MEHNGKLYLLPNKQFTVTLVAPDFYEGKYIPIHPSRLDKVWPITKTFYFSSIKLVLATHGSHLAWNDTRRVGLREAWSRKNWRNPLTDSYESVDHWLDEVDYEATKSLKCSKF
jgi:hypothetical protein